MSEHDRVLPHVHGLRDVPTGMGEGQYPTGDQVAAMIAAAPGGASRFFASTTTTSTSILGSNEAQTPFDQPLTVTISDGFVVGDVVRLRARINCLHRDASGAQGTALLFVGGVLFLSVTPVVFADDTFLDGVNYDFSFTVASVAVAGALRMVGDVAVYTAAGVTLSTSPALENPAFDTTVPLQFQIGWQWDAGSDDTNSVALFSFTVEMLRVS